jgi:hypothetical protein
MYMKGNGDVSLQRYISLCAYEDYAKINSKDNI